MHRLAIQLAFALVLSVAVPCRALDFDTSDFKVTFWEDEHGLVSRGVYSIAQDVTGYLWLGTDAGLFRFDGVTFLPWGELSDSPLPSYRIRALIASQDGGLWIGFRDRVGVIRIRDAMVGNYTWSSAKLSDIPTTIVEDRNGTVWVGGSEGLYKHAGDRWERVGQQDGFPEGVAVDSAYTDGAGSLWVATAEGVVRRSEGKENFERVGGFDRHVHDFSEDSSGVIWFTDPQQGIGRLNQDGRPNSPLEEHIAGTRLLHDRRNNLWVATRGEGLWSLRPTKTGDSLTAIGIPALSQFVFCIFEDREGSVWVGTMNGLVRFMPRRVINVTDLGRLRALETTRDGSVWAGGTEGLTRFTQADEQWRDVRVRLPGGQVSAMYGDREGTLWLATGRGLVRVINGRLPPVSVPGTTHLKRVSFICSDHGQGLKLYDETEGVFRWNEDRLTLDQAPDVGYDPRNLVCPLTAQSAQGATGADDRVEKLQAITDRYGDSDVDPGVYVVKEDQRGDIWVGGSDGLSRLFDGRELSVLESDETLGRVVAMVEDKKGGLWFASTAGVFGLSQSNLDLVSAGHLLNQNRLDRYDGSDGLSGTPIWGGGGKGAVRTDDGKLWFVTSAGLSIINPNIPTTIREPHSVRVDRVTVDGTAFFPQSHSVLPARTRRLDIDYSAATLNSSLRTRFRFRLDGYDKDWVDVGGSRRASYTNLSSRSYQLRIVAFNAGSAQVESTTAWEFSLPPVFYATPQFYIASGVTVCLITWVWWIRHLAHIRDRFRLVLSERVRLSRELHDSLLQGLVGAGIQCEAISRDLDSSGQPARRLVQLRKRINFYVRETRSSISELRSTHSSNDLAADLSILGDKITKVEPVRFTFKVSGGPRPCSVRIRNRLRSFVREALVNVVRHAEAEHVHLELHYDRDSITARVSDDGRGFDVAQGGGDDSADHFGLSMMRELAEEDGGRFRVVSRSGAGTTVEMTF